MLVAIKVELRAEQNAELPADVGRANYAEVLNQFNRIDGTLARAAHEGNGPKPLTCSSLIGAQARGRSLFVQAGDRCALRVTGLTPEISKGLLAVLVASPPAIWRIHGCSFAVTQAVCDAALDPWTGRSTYEALAAEPLLNRSPRNWLSFTFGSPTAFKLGGHHVPLPLPELVFGSLADRWNEFSPTLFSPSMRAFGHEFIAIADYNLRSRRTVTKGNGLVIGGVGSVTYKCFAPNADWLAQVQVLASFAVFSGVGVKTAEGMGQCRCLCESER